MVSCRLRFIHLLNTYVSFVLVIYSNSFEKYLYATVKNPALGDYSGYADECKYNGSQLSSQVFVESYESIFNYRDMIRALRMGPLATYVYVSENMYVYDSGIISADPMCERIGKSVNHAVLIVGFGEENGIYFWKIKVFNLIFLFNSIFLRCNSRGYFSCLF